MPSESPTKMLSTPRFIQQARHRVVVSGEHGQLSRRARAERKSGTVIGRDDRVSLPLTVVKGAGVMNHLAEGERMVRGDPSDWKAEGLSTECVN